MSYTSALAEPSVIATGTEARARISWSAVIAGVVLVIAAQLALSALGAGIGLGMARPGEANASEMAQFGTGAGLWWVGSVVVSLVLGCAAAARLAGVATRVDGVLHGLVIWGVALLLSLYLIGTAAGGLIGGAFSVIGGTVSTAAGTLSGAAKDGAQAMLPGTQPGDAAAQAGRQAAALLQTPAATDPASMNPAEAAKAVVQDMPALLSGGAAADAARGRITAIVAAQAHITPQEAQNRVAQAQARMIQTRDQAAAAARKAADDTAAAASHGAFLGFAGMVIGGLAAALGGALAAPRRALIRLRR
jgi:hypothetical protein